MSEEIKMNLQLFSEEGEVVENSVETVDNSTETPTEEFGAGAEEELATEQGTEEAPAEFDYKPFLEKLSGQMKYNGETVEVNSIEDLITGYQKSLNYDKINGKITDYEEKLNKLNPQVAFAQTLAEKYGFKTVEEYEKAVQEQWKQDEINQLVQNNIPEEYAKEMIENRKFRDTYGKEKETKAAEEAQKQKDLDFIDWHDDMVKQGVFKEAFDAKTMPKEVLEAYQKGEDLKFAYAQHMLMNQRESVQQETIKNLTQNSETSVGAINSQSSTETQPMTNQQVDTLLSGMSESEQSKWIDSNMDNLEKWGYFKKF